MIHTLLEFAHIAISIPKQNLEEKQDKKRKLSRSEATISRSATRIQKNKKAYNWTREKTDLRNI